MKFKSLVITLVVALVVTLVPATSFAADESTAPAEEVTKETTETVTKAAPKKTVKVVKLSKAKFKTTMKSTKNVVVSWSKVKNAKGYVLYKTNADAKKLTKVKSIKASKKRVYSAKVKPGKAVYYTVKAYGKSTKSTKVEASMSKVLKIKTPKRLTPKSKGYKQTNAYKIIKAARGKLGKAYVSGAAGPNSFDCSGYVYYIMNKTKAAKSIKTKRFSRSSAQGEYSQLRKYNIGSKSLKKAQPGDIVFFSRTASTGNIHHVGIYYGNGKIIHASEPRTGVIISPKQHRKVAAIVRLPKL